MATGETTDMDKPVAAVERPTAEQRAGAYEVQYDGRRGDPFQSEEHGVVVHKRDGRYKLCYTHTERYVDAVLVPFFTYYNDVTRVDTF